MESAQLARFDRDFLFVGLALVAGLRSRTGALSGNKGFGAAWSVVHTRDFIRRKQMKIAEKMYVAFEYCLTTDAGEEIDRSPAGEPLGFITGSGQIIPGLEKAMIGMTAGDSSRITVEPEDAYGLVQDEMFQQIPREQFPDDVDIEPGMSFEAQGPRGPFMITVSTVNDDNTVTVDLNHPLAGKRLNFDVTVTEVREATAAELAPAGGCGCGCGTEEKPKAEAGCGSGSGGGCNCGC